MSWRLVYEVTMDFISVISFGIGDGIRNHLQPIIAKFLEPVSKFGSKLISFACAVVSFPE